MSHHVLHIVHLLAAALWLGGLALLVLSWLPEMLRTRDPRLLWVWLGYAMVIAWKLVRLQGSLERVQRSLLLPRKDE